MPAETILVVDDERSILEAVRGVLEDEGYHAVLVEDGEGALDFLRGHEADLVLLDIWLPGRDGVSILQEITQEHPALPVVMMSGHGTIETAVRTTKLGAYDFIEKPLSLEKTLLVVRHALEERRLQEENLALRRRMSQSVELVGAGPAARTLREQAALAARGEGRVLITGERGAGKELLARNIHLLGPRRDGPFTEVRCATLTEDAGELLGREGGAPGQPGRRRGRIELADRGTLFLDEVAEMPPAAQARLERVLEEGVVQRIGGERALRVDMRVIAATQHDLEERIARGLFRVELYDLLNVVRLRVPPLRERPEDIPLLAEHFLRLFCLQTARRPKSLSDAATARLRRHPWPGNVRELKNLIERAVIMVAGETLEEGDLGLP